MRGAATAGLAGVVAAGNGGLFVTKGRSGWMVLSSSLVWFVGCVINRIYPRADKCTAGVMMCNEVGGHCG